MSLRVINFADGFTSNNVPSEIQGAYVTYSLETINNLGEISSSASVGFQRRAIVGSGAVTTSNNPFGTDGWQDGLVITLLGTDDTNTVTIPFLDGSYGCLINGQCTLGNGQSITLQWNEDDLRWYEISRNN
jgi:hypothetical protein